MYLCKVEGKCISTIKTEKLKGYSLLIVQKINKAGKGIGDIIVAVDTIGCSVGEIVLVSKGRTASYAIDDGFSPVDASIIGIVDNYEI